MWWKPLGSDSRVKLLVTYLSVSILAVILVAQFIAAAERPDEPKALAVVNSAVEETSAGISGIGVISAEPIDDASAMDPSREAAAGPELDDPAQTVSPGNASERRGLQKPSRSGASTMAPDRLDDTGSRYEAAAAARGDGHAGLQARDAGPTLDLAPAPQIVRSHVKRVGIQVGHWKAAELPAELATLRTATGAYGGGVTESQLNLDIAKRVASLLEAKGLNVDVLPATIPPGYQADAFVSLHADGNASGLRNGFKLARATSSAMPAKDDALLADVRDEYRAATRLRWDDNITSDMTGYYAFANRRLKHTIAPTTPAVILELGYLTSASDRLTLFGKPDAVAAGIARGILRFLGLGEE